jgi:predicted secreted protein
MGAEVPDEVTLRRGERATISLPSASGGGYRWTVSVDDEVIDARVQVLPPEAPGEPPSSGAAPERLVIDARRPGNATLSLTLARRWEADAPAARQTIRVTVEPDRD